MVIDYNLKVNVIDDIIFLNTVVFMDDILPNQTDQI